MRKDGLHAEQQSGAGNRFRSYLEAELRIAASRRFAILGIREPEPCLFAWFACYGGGRTRHEALSSRRKHAASGAESGARLSSMDVLEDEQFLHVISHLLLAEHRLRPDVLRAVLWDLPAEMLDKVLQDPDPAPVGCESVYDVCVPWRCPRWRYGGPSWDEYGDLNEAPLDEFFRDLHERRDEPAGITALQIPLAGRKTSAVARFAAAQALDRAEGRPFYLVVDTHKTAEDFFSKLHDARICPELQGRESDYRIVAKVGRDEVTCPEITGKGSAADCRKCGRSAATRRLLGELKREGKLPGGVSREMLLKLAGDGCAFTLSRALARSADVVVLAQDYVLNPVLWKHIPELKGRGENHRLIVWDEADTILEKLTQYAAREFPVFRRTHPELRSSKPYPGYGRCHHRCDECMPACPAQHEGDPLATLTEILERGAWALSSIYHNLECSSPAVSIGNAMANLHLLTGCLYEQLGGVEQCPCDIPKKLKEDLPASLREKGLIESLRLFELPFMETTSADTRRRLTHAVLMMDQRGGFDDEALRVLLGDDARKDYTRPPGVTRPWLSPAFYRCVVLQELREGSFRDADCIAQLLRFADVADGPTARLEINPPRQRTASNWSPCSIYLRRFDRELVEEALDYVSDGTCAMLSGTFLDAESLSAQLGRHVEFQQRGSGDLHDSVVFVIWNHRIGSAVIQNTDNYRHPAEVNRHELLALINEVRRRTGDIPVLVFTDSKAKRKSMAPDEPGVGELGDPPMRLLSDGIHEAHVSYLRSTVSRGHELPEYRLCVVHGNGYQSGRDIRLDVSCRSWEDADGQGEGESQRTDLYDRLMRYGRRRAVAQAAARTCRDGTRRVVLLAGEFTYADLPKYMWNRVVFANEILESSEAPTDQYDAAGRASPGKKQWQCEQVAGWVARWLAGEEPTRKPYEWAVPCTDAEAESRFQQMLDSDERFPAVCRQVLEVVREHGCVRKYGPASKPWVDGWSETLDTLKATLVLRRAYDPGTKRQFRCEAGELFFVLENWCDRAKDHPAPDTLVDECLCDSAESRDEILRQIGLAP